MSGRAAGLAGLAFVAVLLLGGCMVGPDYEMGRSTITAFQNDIKRLGGADVGSTFPPLGAKDFSTYLGPIRAAQPDVIITATAGNDTVRLLSQLNDHLTEPIQDCLALDADGRPCLEAKTPLDLERDLAMPGGNIFHGDLDWPWRDDDDPDRWGVATDDPRILRAGASARRGGGVSGVAGHNAAMALLTHT